jgi:hypothetical protein
LAVSLLALSGCGSANYLDPYQKPGVWKPLDTPAANISAQVVDPRDLVTGRGTSRQDTQASSLAIQHIWLDTPKSFISDSGGGGGASAAGPGASGAGAGGSGSGGGGSGGSGGSN